MVEDFNAFRDTGIYERYMLNQAQFSAAKSEAETKMLQSLVFDEDKTRRSFSEFKKEAKQVTDIINDTWLRTEYDTAVRQAGAAEQIKRMREDKDLYPYWRYLRTISFNPRDEHLKLVGQVFRIGDPVGDLIMPPNGFNCFDPQTSVYTNRGFLPFTEVLEDDLILTLNPVTKSVEWTNITGFISYHHEGKMISIEKLNMSVLVTPDHAMLVQKSWDNHEGRDILKFIPAKSIASSDRIYKSINWDFTPSETITIAGIEWKSSSYAKFMGWWLSEGCIIKRGDDWYQMSIKQLKPDLFSEMVNDCKESPFKLWVGKEAVTIRLPNTVVGEYFMQFGKAHQKFIPDDIKFLSKENIALFVNRFIKGDGHIQPGKMTDSGYMTKPIECVFSSSKKLIDDFAELVLKIGKSCTYSVHYKKGKVSNHHNGVYASNHDVHRLNISPYQYTGVTAKQIKEVDYNGMVYCLEVAKNNTLLIQRRGKIYWSGNCGCGMESVDDNQVMDEGLSIVKDAEPYLKDVSPQFRFNAADQGILPKESHSYHEVLPNANAAGGKDFGITGKSARRTTKLGAVGLHGMIETVHQWKSKYHTSDHGDTIVFQNTRSYTNVRFTNNSLHEIQKHSAGFDQLADTVINPDEIWSYWEDTAEQRAVLRNYISGHYIVQTKDGIIKDAFLVDDVNRFRKGVIIL